MALHPLAKELLSARLEYTQNRELFRTGVNLDKIVRGYLTGKAKWLKDKFTHTMLNQPSLVEAIDQAFQLTPETLEGKFQAIRQKYEHTISSPIGFWGDVLKEFAETAEEHFNNQPSAAQEQKK